MLEYNLKDAEELLEKNLSAAQKSLAQVEEDLGFLRDQTTTSEVSILENYPYSGKCARMCRPILEHNWTPAEKGSYIILKGLYS